MSTDSTIPTKICTKCGQEFPATTEYFYRAKRGIYGLKSACKTCTEQYKRSYYELNRETVLEKQRQYNKNNKDAVSARSKKYFKNNKKRILEQAKEYRRRNQNKERANSYHKNYKEQNPDKIKSAQRRYRLNNAERIAKSRSDYYRKNRQKIQIRRKAWAKENPEKIRIYSARRIARKQSLPDTFTPEQWVTCLEYFNYCCAVCGRQLRDLFGNIEPHADHWIPIASNDCTGTVVENMVCLCNTCNLTKNAKDPKKWLLENHSVRKANEILNRIQDYFEWVLSHLA